MSEWRKQRRIKRLRDMRNKHHDYCIHATIFFRFTISIKWNPKREKKIVKSMHVGKKDISFGTQAE